MDPTSDRQAESCADDGPSFVTTFNSNTYYPILKQLRENLTGGSIINLSKTCRQYSTFYRDARRVSVSVLYGRSGG